MIGQTAQLALHITADVTNLRLAREHGLQHGLKLFLPQPLLGRLRREIELMREYRTRLISDVVTGQVDVRGIEVPEVAEEELPALDEDTAESDDVIDDEGDMDETN